jgi:preprotein translocase subunit SecB
MAEDTDTPENEAVNNKSFIHLQAVYIKDVSFESPNSPHIFKSEEFNPTMDLGYGLQAVNIEEDIIEVILKVSLHAKLGDQTAYMVELQQAGVFHTGEHTSKEQLDWILQVYCPNIIFPYARAEIAQLISQGGFPPYHLVQMNFEAMYHRNLQRQVEQTAGD